MSSCKKCGAEIVWEKTQTGKFKPPQNPDGTRHTCGDTTLEKAERPVIGDPNYQSDPVLLEKAEKRVREIVHEELTRLFVDLAVTYKKASQK